MSFQAPIFLLGLLVIPLALLALLPGTPPAGQVRHPLPRRRHAWPRSSARRAAHGGSSRRRCCACRWPVW